MGWYHHENEQDMFSILEFSPKMEPTEDLVLAWGIMEAEMPFPRWRPRKTTV